MAFPPGRFLVTNDDAVRRGRGQSGVTRRSMIGSSDLQPRLRRRRRTSAYDSLAKVVPTVVARVGPAQSSRSRALQSRGLRVRNKSRGTATVGARLENERSQSESRVPL